MVCSTPRGPSPAADNAGDHRRVSLLVGLLFGFSAMGSAAVAITLRALAKDLGLTTSGVVWVISLYALLLAVTTPLYGRLADRAGIRGPLVVGVGLMAGGAVTGALAPNFELLLAARLLQGAAPVLSGCPTTWSKVACGSSRKR